MSLKDGYVGARIAGRKTRAGEPWGAGRMRAPSGNALPLGGLGMCPPTPSQQERVSGVPRSSSAEANAGSWAGTVAVGVDTGRADGLEEEEGKGPSRRRPASWAHVGRVAGLGPAARGGRSRSVSLGKERRPLNRPAFQRPCRSGKCQEPAADEQRWGRPLGLGHLRQRRSERPRGRPRGRRPPTRVRAEWTQTGCVPTAPPSCWQ